MHFTIVTLPVIILESNSILCIVTEPIPAREEGADSGISQ